MSSNGAAANPKSATRKSRNASPAPKAAAINAAAKETPSAQEPEKKASEVVEAQMFGLHPEAFRAMVVAPLVVVVILATTAGPGRPYIQAAIAVATPYWKTVSSPIEKFLVEQSHVLVVVGAGAAFMPLVALAIVLSCRAMQDLNKFELWQKLALAALVLAALATLKSEAMVWFKGTWDSMRDPLQKLLTERADAIVAGSALASLFPVVLAIISSFLRCVRGCRVEPAASDAKEQDIKK